MVKTSSFFPVAEVPDDLGQSMTSVLEKQVSKHTGAGLCAPHVEFRLFETLDLTAEDRRVLESQRRSYDTSHLTRDAASLKRWVEKRILRRDDAAAREAIAEQLGITEPMQTAEDLLELNALDPDLVTDLLAGKLGSAIHRIPAEGYPDEAGHGWSADDVLTIVEAVARLWAANDLQMEAALAHVRIFRPTQCEILDGEFTGRAPIQGGLAAKLQHDLRLFEAVDGLYRKARNDTDDDCVPHTVNLAAHCALRPDIPEKEVKKVFEDPRLEQEARMWLVACRAKHGDELEGFIDKRMKQARAELRRMRHELESIRSDKSRRLQRAAKLQGTDPLVCLWLACQRAVAWTTPCGAPGGANGEPQRDFLERAVKMARSGCAITHPHIAAGDVQPAQRLFAALRYAIVKDPEHLPTGLLVVSLPGGGVRKTTSQKMAEEVRGEPFTFAEIWNHQLSRINARNSAEVFSHTRTTMANELLENHGVAPTAESQRVLRRAWGTISWRLTQ